MVFSMNVFKNKKRWQNKKTLKTLKKRTLNKKRKKRFFYIYAARLHTTTCPATVSLRHAQTTTNISTLLISTYTSLLTSLHSSITASCVTELIQKGDTMTFTITHQGHT